ncbi:hypothetical protein [Solidesulfovibrio sp.]
MKSLAQLVFLTLITFMWATSANASPVLDVCGKIYDIYGAFSRANYTELQQQQYFDANLKGNIFNVTGRISDIKKSDHGLKIVIDDDKCVTIFADITFPNKSTFDYVLSLNKKDSIAIDGTVTSYSNKLGASIWIENARVICPTCGNHQEENKIPAKENKIELNRGETVKNKCPEKVLSSGKIEGTYLGTECGDYCYSTIQTAVNKSVTIMCGEDESIKYFGEATGNYVQAFYDVVQFYNEYGQECKVAKVCKSGNVSTKYINPFSENSIFQFISKREHAFMIGDISTILNFYGSNVLFYGQAMTNEQLEKSFIAYTKKWTTRRNKIINLKEIAVNNDGTCTVIFDFRFSHSTSDGKCMSGMAKSQIKIAKNASGYIIIEEKNIFTEKDNVPICN